MASSPPPPSAADPTAAAAAAAAPPTESEVDAIWASSRTARQMYALGQVERDIGHLLQIAARSIALLSLPETDAADEGLPQGDERSEQFVAEANEYFELLDAIGQNLRAQLAHVRQARVPPSTILAPAAGAVPPSLGTGMPSHAAAAAASGGPARAREAGLQEERVGRDAWAAALGALQRLKAARAMKTDQPQADGS